MNRIIRTFLFWTLLLSACAPIFPSTQAVPKNQSLTPEPPTVVSVATTQELSDSPTLENPSTDQSPEIATTVVPSNPQECAYQWAYQDLPQLSGNFLQSVQTIQSEAQANAFAFGENCVHADGSGTFLAMETDFNITLQTSDLSNESDLGEWIVKVMQIIEQIPADQIVGPRPGRVSITFQSSGGQNAVTFYIDKYRALPTGLSSEEIYKALQTP
jgi:hypothetical protein